MKTVKDLETGSVKRRLVSMHIGESGSGKTHLAATYPKCFFVITEPNSEETWMNKPELKANVVGFEHFIPDKENFKGLFANLLKEIALAKKMYADGEVETLVIDNLTYLIHNRWLWLNEFDMRYGKSGEIDVQKMYGTLRSWGYDFLLKEVISFPGHVVCNVHEMLESDDAMEKKIDKTMTNVPNIIGGLRNEVDGLFSNVFYLSKLPLGKGQYKYMCRTNKGNGRLAKNRFNLPEIIEDVSYARIMEAMNKSKGGDK